jgi:8-amino-7-oxononanoate synthase
MPQNQSTSMNDSFLEQGLSKRKRLGSYRELRLNKGKIDFASNDYLGFARSERLFQSTLLRWLAYSLHHAPMGSTGSRLISGNQSEFEKTEHEIAAFHERESCLLFSCGYIANMGLASCLGTDQDTLLFDADVHTSMKEGIRRSLASAYPFRHNDIQHLKRRILQVKGRCFVFVESLYSTDGSLAPLQEIASLCQDYGALLIVDEAHSTGLFGQHGKGLISSFGLEKMIFASVHTFGKALGVQGAAVIGSALLKQHLVNFCLPFIYSTGMQPVQLLSIGCAYQQLMNADPLRENLKRLIQYFDQSIQQWMPSFPSSCSPIKALIASEQKLKQIANHLSSHGIDVGILRSPTVRKGKETIRICLHTYNSFEEIDLLSALLKRSLL